MGLCRHVAKVGDKVAGGDVLGTGPGDPLHPAQDHGSRPDAEGTVESIHVRLLHRHRHGGRACDWRTAATSELTMMQKWPVRVGRPYKQQISPPPSPCSPASASSTPCSPWPRAAPPPSPAPSARGKTVVQHALAKWSDVDIVVYIGCGERGNEMTDVLREFPELIDPRTGETLMKRTVLIANTSDMPVAAREASIYTGITIAEYFRDMGYDVAVIADSTSRWAEALREMSGRLEEMPGEEGYPAYLASRIAAVLRARRRGPVPRLRRGPPRQPDRRGRSLASRRRPVRAGQPGAPCASSRCSGALDSSLAYRRHFPAINWLNSYSLYLDNLKPWFDENLGESFLKNRDTRHDHSSGGGRPERDRPAGR